MAWIESHQSLLNHRKTLRAATILKVDKLKLIGHLHALWWWALDSADNDGLMGDVRPEEIADVALWPRRTAAAFVQALIDCGGGEGRPGFIELTDEGYVLHNWRKYAGKLNEKKAKDRERKQSGIPTEVARKSQAPTNQPNQPTNQPGGGAARARPTIFGLYEQLFGGGAINGMAFEKLKAIEEEHPAECIEHCFQQASTVTPRPKSLAYVTSMLERHRREGCDDKRIPQTAGGVSARGARRSASPGFDTDAWEAYARGDRD